MRCSLLRPRWRTTGRVWVTHRRTLLGWITRTGVVDRHFYRAGGDVSSVEERPLSAHCGGWPRDLVEYVPRPP